MGGRSKYVLLALDGGGVHTPGFEALAAGDVGDDADGLAATLHGQSPHQHQNNRGTQAHRNTQIHAPTRTHTR
jgi:hypothetical protein